MELPQPGLGQLRHRVHPGESRRVHGLQRAADVDHTEQPPVPRIGDRRARTGPGDVRPYEVLAGEHLDRPPYHRRGAHSVGADDVFPPVRAEFEAEPVRLPQHRRRPLTPQHAPVGVRDDHDVLGDVRDRKQSLPQHRQDVPQRRLLPPAPHLVRGQQPGPEVVFGVDATAQHPSPRLLDHRTGREPRTLPGERGLTHLAQHPRRLRRVHGGQARHVHRRVHHCGPPGKGVEHTCQAVRAAVSGPTVSLILPFRTWRRHRLRACAPISCNPLQPW